MVDTWWNIRPPGGSIDPPRPRGGFSKETSHLASAPTNARKRRPGQTPVSAADQRPPTHEQGHETPGISERTAQHRSRTVLPGKNPRIVTAVTARHRSPLIDSQDPSPRLQREVPPCNIAHHIRPPFLKRKAITRSDRDQPTCSLCPASFKGTLSLPPCERVHSAESTEPVSVITSRWLWIFTELAP